VSRLARQGIVTQGRAHTTPARPKSRWTPLAARDETITSDHVRTLMDQEGL
jgi:hypothetical protein